MSPGWPARLSHGDVVLRPVSRRDAPAWREARRRSADWLTPWEATVPPGGAPRPASFGALAKGLTRSAAQGTSLPFVIEVEGHFAGQITVSSIVRGSAMFCSVGYWIDVAFAGRGAVPTALALVIDHCFGPVGLHRVEIAIRPENSNSLRVVEKLGIREVGYAPRYLHINGQWCDHRIFAVTAEEVVGTVVGRLGSTS
ncbi:MAG: GNAT family N-acetyltransferase [Nocardioides sp.]